MADTKTQVREFIDSLEIPAGVKETLLAKLEAEGVTPDLFVEIKLAIADLQIKLQEQYRPQLDQLTKLEEQEQAELAQAYGEFKQEMDVLEEDAEIIDEAAAKAAGDQELKDIRSKIAS